MIQSVHENASERIDGRRQTHQVDGNLQPHLVLQRYLHEVDVQNGVGHRVLLHVSHECGPWLLAVQSQVDDIVTSRRAQHVFQITCEDLNSLRLHVVPEDVRRRHTLPTHLFHFLPQHFPWVNVELCSCRLDHLSLLRRYSSQVSTAADLPSTTVTPAGD